MLDNINKRLNLDRPLTCADIVCRALRGSAVGGESPAATMTTIGCDGPASTKSRWIRPGRISVFGGKLTDCINVGDEVSRIVARLGICPAASRSSLVWRTMRRFVREYLRQARLMKLDSHASPNSGEPLQPVVAALRPTGANCLPKSARTRMKRNVDRRYRLSSLRNSTRRAGNDRQRRTSAPAFQDRADHASGISGTIGLMEICEILFGDRARGKARRILPRLTGSPGGFRCSGGPSVVG